MLHFAWQEQASGPCITTCLLREQVEELTSLCFPPTIHFPRLRDTRSRHQRPKLTCLRRMRLRISFSAHTCTILRGLLRQ